MPRLKSSKLAGFMTVSPGGRVGPYEIIDALGAGGMGEVFRARDTKLNRDVAIKVLPAAFADDPERLARFTREAQNLASLNHPYIAAIYGIEEIASSGSSAGLVAMTTEVSNHAAFAIHHGLGVLHRDRDFAALSRVSPLLERDSAG